MNKELKNFIVLLTLLVTTRLVADDATLGTLADNVRGSLAAIATLIFTISYVAGIMFILTGFVKFKAHKDNPTQVPLSAPLVLVGIGSALMFFPTMLDVAGSTVFGGDQESAKQYLDTSTSIL